MVIGKKLIKKNESEGFAQGELIVSGQSSHLAEANEQELRDYIFNQGTDNDVLDKSFVFTSNVI
jgi:hypothetical protein